MPIDKSTPLGDALVDIAQEIAAGRYSCAVLTITTRDGYRLRMRISLDQVLPQEAEPKRLAEWDAAMGPLQ